MVYLLYHPAAISHYLGGEVAHIAIGIYNPCAGVNSDSWMFIDLVDEIGNKTLDIPLLNGIAYRLGHPAKHRTSLDKLNLKSLVR